MKEAYKILLGICSLSGLCWVFGPEGKEKIFPDWKHSTQIFLTGLFLVAVFWTLTDLWGSDRTTDSKLYWTVLGALFSPFVVPAYFLPPNN